MASIISTFAGANWRRYWCCYFYLGGWDSWSLGLHVCPSIPNIEVHVPFGFFRIGWELLPPMSEWERDTSRVFGWQSYKTQARDILPDDWIQIENLWKGVSSGD